MTTVPLIHPPAAIRGSPRRICLMRLSALGDVCLILPLVRTLQHALPEAEITWVIGRPMHGLLRGLDGVEFIVVDKARPLQAWLEFYRRMRRRRFDVLLATQASWRAHMLYPAIRAPLKVGFDRHRSPEGHGWFVNARIGPGRQHLLDSFLSFAAALGITQTVVDWRLPIGEPELAFAREQLGPHPDRWLAVNPSASKRVRNWLPDRYAAVINQAQERWRWRTVLTGSSRPRERILGDAVLARVQRPDRVLDLIGRTSPKQLAAVLGRASVLLAPDTGPVHLATAMGCPVAGLYAVAPPEFSGPYCSPHLVVNRFPEAVRQFLGKDPATLPWGTRVQTPKAMALITVDDVMRVLAPLLEHPRPFPDHLSAPFGLQGSNSSPQPSPPPPT